MHNNFLIIGHYLAGISGHMEIMDVQNEVFHTNLTIIMPLENMTAEIISPENISGKKLKLGILVIKNLD